MGMGRGRGRGKGRRFVVSHCFTRSSTGSINASASASVSSSSSRSSSGSSSWLSLNPLLTLSFSLPFNSTISSLLVIVHTTTTTSSSSDNPSPHEPPTPSPTPAPAPAPAPAPPAPEPKPEPRPGGKPERASGPRALEASVAVRSGIRSSSRSGLGSRSRRSRGGRSSSHIANERRVESDRGHACHDCGERPSSNTSERGRCSGFGCENAWLNHKRREQEGEWCSCGAPEPGAAPRGVDGSGGRDVEHGAQGGTRLCCLLLNGRSRSGRCRRAGSGRESSRRGRRGRV